MLFERLCTRSKHYGIPPKIPWHRGLLRYELSHVPFLSEQDEIFSGWINLNSDSEQFFFG
jgi:hypothetical protein